MLLMFALVLPLSPKRGALLMCAPDATVHTFVYERHRAGQWHEQGRYQLEANYSQSTYSIFC